MYAWYLFVETKWRPLHKNKAPGFNANRYTMHTGLTFGNTLTRTANLLSRFVLISD